MHISHDDPRLSWHGHVSLERTPDFTRPLRLPFDQRTLFPPLLADRASTQAGVRLAFHSDSPFVKGQVAPFAQNQLLDLYLDGAMHGSVSLADQSEFAFEGIPEGRHLIELWLPQRGDFALRGLELADGASLAPYEDTRPRWITYGSSITHCGTAASPSFTWPAIVARERGLNLTCLGYGGQCHLDVLVARMIRDLPADYISICAGINIYGQASLNERSFVPALIGSVCVIREKHPRVPIALISPIFSCHRETEPNAVGWTLQDYRQGVREAVEILRGAGDAAVHYIHGPDLFGGEHSHLLPDNLHPNAEGYEVLGRNFLRLAAPVFMNPDPAAGSSR